MLESVLNKVASLQACNVIERRRQHNYFPVKFAKFCSFFLIAPVLEFLLNKFASFQIRNFIKKRLQHRCFPVKFAKFLRTPILKIICERLLL